MYVTRIEAKAQSNKCYEEVHGQMIRSKPSWAQHVSLVAEVLALHTQDSVRSLV